MSPPSWLTSRRVFGMLTTLGRLSETGRGGLRMDGKASRQTRMAELPADFCLKIFRIHDSSNRWGDFHRLIREEFNFLFVKMAKESDQNKKLIRQVYFPKFKISLNTSDDTQLTYLERMGAYNFKKKNVEYTLTSLLAPLWCRKKRVQRGASIPPFFLFPNSVPGEISASKEGGASREVRVYVRTFNFTNLPAHHKIQLKTIKHHIGFELNEHGITFGQATVMRFVKQNAIERRAEDNYDDDDDDNNFFMKKLKHTVSKLMNPLS